MNNDESTDRGLTALERYANRGSDPGADEVLAAARAQGTYVADPAKHRSRSSGLRVLIGVAIVLAIVGLIAFGSRDDASQVASDAGSAEAPKPAEEPTPAELEEAAKRYEEQRAAGWVPLAPEAALPNVDVPRELWVEAGEGLAPPGLDAVEMRIPVYDAPGGEGKVVGYHYSNLGYLPLELAESFDSHAARVEKFGCDPAFDAVCVEQLVEADAGAGAGE